MLFVLRHHPRSGESAGRSAAVGDWKLRAAAAALFSAMCHNSTRHSPTQPTSAQPRSAQHSAAQPSSGQASSGQLSPDPAQLSPAFGLGLECWVGFSGGGCATVFEVAGWLLLIRPSHVTLLTLRKNPKFQERGNSYCST